MLGPLNRTGSLWTQEIGGVTYRHEDTRYVLTEGGRVLVEGEDRVFVEAPTEAAQAILDQAAEDAAILQNRRDYARQAAEGNEALETVLLGSMAFEDGEPELDEIKEHPELKVAQVGRNASHYFYLGASEDGKLFKLSMDVYEYYENIEGALHCRELTPEQPAGYLGHM